MEDMDSSGNKQSLNISITFKGVVESMPILNSDGAWILKRMHQESSWFLAIPRYILKRQEQSEFQYLHANYAIHM